jgi:hypothetical protein
MRAQRLREEAVEKERDEHFNIIQPMIPVKQEWRVKEKTSTVALTTFDANMDLFDDDEPPLIKEGSPPPTDMDINMVFTLSVEFRRVDEEITQLCLGSNVDVFKKYEESSQHLKHLYFRGHIDGRLISMMLIDGGAVVNLMLYFVFKKLEREDDELMKTNLTLNNLGGNLMEDRGVVSMELTVRKKSLAIAFFVVEVQGNYNVILGHDWIHTNHCVPSILHQFLIQWINDEIEVVHVDTSAYIASADATVDWQHGSTHCLSGKDLLGYDFLSVTKDRFVPMFVHPIFEARLGDVVFQ